MAVPSTFFDKIVADIAELYGIVDGDSLPVENSPVVRLAVRYAYAQIVSHTNTSYHKIERTVCYYDVYGPLQLKHTPYDANATTVVTVDNEVLAASDYIIAGNIFYIGDVATPDLCYESGKFVKIQSTAGYDAATDNETLEAALLMQGIANYNRRDLLGFVETRGEGGTTRALSDKGGLLQAVKDLLAPLVYYGDGIECS